MTTPVIRFPVCVGYEVAAALQDRLVAERIADRIGDVILVLEHRPVITLGRRQRDQHLLASPEALKERGIDLAVASRGGDVTYHGPGQLVLYPILKLDGYVAGAHGYLDQLESIAVGTAAGFGVDAFRREGKSGAWTAQGKIAAIGFRLKRWVTQHGLSFNVDPDLDGFQLIVPCGLVGESVSSLRRILGDGCPTMDQAAAAMIGELARVFRRDVTVVESPDAESDSLLQVLHELP